MVGIVLVAVGGLRAGWLATLLSIPVTTGFLAGISIHIIVGELPTLLGISEERGQMLVRLVHVVGRIPEANPYAFALGAGVLIVTAGTARISPRIPGALIGLVGAGIAVALFDLEARGVSLLGALSIPLPHLALPTLPGMDELTRCPCGGHGLHYADSRGGGHVPVRRTGSRKCEPRLRRGRRGLHHDSGPEVLLVAASAVLVIALPIETGMLLAMVLSFVHSLYIVARPYCVELARVPGSTVWWPPGPGG